MFSIFDLSHLKLGWQVYILFHDTYEEICTGGNNRKCLDKNNQK